MTDITGDGSLLQKGDKLIEDRRRDIFKMPAAKRSYSWLSGRSNPRSAQLDLATVHGLDAASNDLGNIAPELIPNDSIATKSVSPLAKMKYTIIINCTSTGCRG